jgi:hypothetical protein
VDAVAVVQTAEGILICVADGSGGTGCGGLAANLVVDAVQTAAAGGLAALTSDRLLTDLDREPVTNSNGGQTTAVVYAVVGSDVFGVSPERRRVLVGQRGSGVMG